MRERQMIDTGFVVFASVLVLNMLGLFADLILLWLKQPTITEMVWEYPALGIPIIVIQLVGLVGLSCHFWFRTATNVL